jgi:hypothetical protein
MCELTLFSVYRSILSLQAGLSYAAAGLQHGHAPDVTMFRWWIRRLGIVEGDVIEVYMAKSGAPNVPFFLQSIYFINGN